MSEGSGPFALPGLDGRIAVVTGGSRGLGRAIVGCLLEAGVHVISVSHDEERVARMNQEIDSHGWPARAVILDVADVAAVDRLVDICAQQFGTPSLLVNCAGVITRDLDLDLAPEVWQRVIDVNLTGAFLVSRALIPGMIAGGGGSIVNITSQMAYLPHPGASPSYEASKAGLLALTRHQAMRHARSGVRVNSIAPGTIDTGLAADMNPAAFQRILDGIPVGFMGEPLDVARATAFLLSDAARYITGASLGVNGGSLML